MSTMSTNSLHTKWVARFFVLIYLLLITSTGNAFFWCKDVKSNAHLESSLSGTCWMPCSSEQKEPQSDEQTSNESVVFSLDMSDCIDSPVCSSVLAPSNQKSPKNKATETDISTPNSSSLLAKCLSSNPGTPSFAHHLPPRQALTALRTVIILC